MNFPWILSMMVGFLSLSQEILWVRLIGFAFGGAPVAFAFVLTCYLVGIALGAAVGKWMCDRSADLYRVSAFVLLAAALTDLLPPFIGGLLAERVIGATMLLIAISIIITAAIKSVLFPIAHHLGSNQSGPRVGSSVSKIYFGNIIGSTLGPVVTGFYLLDVTTVDISFQIVACLSFGMAVLCAVWAENRTTLVATAGIGAVCAALAMWLPASEFVRSSGDLWAGNVGDKTMSGHISNVIENKHGVIHTVTMQGRDDDVI